MRIFSASKYYKLPTAQSIPYLIDDVNSESFSVTNYSKMADLASTVRDRISRTKLKDKFDHNESDEVKKSDYAKQ
jgi:hypothetical protein